MSAKDKVILALDLPQTEGDELLKVLEHELSWVKLGMSLFYEAGPDYLRKLKDEGYKVFLDLKLHDIPHQVELACKNISKLGADMLTIHASGGSDMIAAAKSGLEGSDTKLLCVSVLTSSDQEMLSSIGVTKELQRQVKDLSALSFAAGADGMVCSAKEAALIKELTNENHLIVTPGIRPAGSDNQDQKRVMTPDLAIKNGATHLVIGRPITQAKDSREALAQIYESLSA